MEVPNIYIGNDLVDVARIHSSINRFGKKFLDRIYSEYEQKYCMSKSKPEIHYAGRFAAKEAIIKSLKSSGYKLNIPFNCIEILSGDSGEPIVKLNFTINGLCRVSISHTESHAIASAIYFK